MQYHDLLDWYESQYCGGRTDQPPVEDLIRRMRGLGKEIWAGVDSDAYVNELRSGWDNGEPASPGGIPLTDAESVWSRLVEHQGSEFRTKRGLLFTYKVDGNGIWFFREGRLINQRLSRRELEEALDAMPLDGPADLKELRDSSYLYGLLKDPRIIGSTSRAA